LQFHLFFVSPFSLHLGAIDVLEEVSSWYLQQNAVGNATIASSGGRNDQNNKINNNEETQNYGEIVLQKSQRISVIQLFYDLCLITTFAWSAANKNVSQHKTAGSAATTPKNKNNNSSSSKKNSGRGRQSNLNNNQAGELFLNRNHLPIWPKDVLIALALHWLVFLCFMQSYDLLSQWKTIHFPHVPSTSTETRPGNKPNNNKQKKNKSTMTNYRELLQELLGTSSSSSSTSSSLSSPFPSPAGNLLCQSALGLVEDISRHINIVQTQSIDNADIYQLFTRLKKTTRGRLKTPLFFCTILFVEAHHDQLRAIYDQFSRSSSFSSSRLGKTTTINTNTRSVTGTIPIITMTRKQLEEDYDRNNFTNDRNDRWRTGKEEQRKEDDDKVSVSPHSLQKQLKELEEKDCSSLSILQTVLTAFPQSGLVQETTNNSTALELICSYRFQIPLLDKTIIQEQEKAEKKRFKTIMKIGGGRIGIADRSGNNEWKGGGQGNNNNSASRGGGETEERGLYGNHSGTTEEDKDKDIEGVLSLKELVAAVDRQDSLFSLLVGQTLALHCPSANYLADRNGLFPIHSVARRGHLSLLRFLYSTYPFTVTLRDLSGKCLLHHLLLNWEKHSEETILEVARLCPELLFENNSSHGYFSSAVSAGSSSNINNRQPVASSSSSLSATTADSSRFKPLSFAYSNCLDSLYSQLKTIATCYNERKVLFEKQHHLLPTTTTGGKKNSIETTGLLEEEEEEEDVSHDDRQHNKKIKRTSVNNKTKSPTLSTRKGKTHFKQYEEQEEGEEDYSNEDESDEEENDDDDDEEEQGLDQDQDDYNYRVRSMNRLGGSYDQENNKKNKNSNSSNNNTIKNKDRNTSNSNNKHLWKGMSTSSLLHNDYPFPTKQELHQQLKERERQAQRQLTQQQNQQFDFSRSISESLLPFPSENRNHQQNKNPFKGTVEEEREEREVANNNYINNNNYEEDEEDDDDRSLVSRSICDEDNGVTVAVGKKTRSDLSSETNNLKISNNQTTTICTTTAIATALPQESSLLLSNQHHFHRMNSSNNNNNNNNNNNYENYNNLVNHHLLPGSSNIAMNNNNNNYNYNNIPNNMNNSTSYNNNYHNHNNQVTPVGDFNQFMLFLIAENQKKLFQQAMFSNPNHNNPLLPTAHVGNGINTSTLNDLLLSSSSSQPFLTNHNNNITGNNYNHWNNNNSSNSDGNHRMTMTTSFPQLTPNDNNYHQQYLFSFLQSQNNNNNNNNSCNYHSIPNNNNNNSSVPLTPSSCSFLLPSVPPHSHLFHPIQRQNNNLTSPSPNPTHNYKLNHIGSEDTLDEMSEEEEENSEEEHDDDDRQPSPAPAPPVNNKNDKSRNKSKNASSSIPVTTAVTRQNSKNSNNTNSINKRKRKDTDYQSTKKKRKRHH
jgi:hypothetical protein